MFNFLNNKINFFGLDISDNFIRVALIKKNGNDLFLTSYGEKEISSNLSNKEKIKNENLLAEEIKDLVNNVNGEKIRTRYVAVALPEEKSFFQIIKMPKMSESELRKSIFYEAENYIPLPVDDVYLDFQIVSSNKDFLEILISAVPKKIIDFYVHLIEKAGFFPVVIEPEPISIIRSIVDKKDNNEPILLLNIQESKSIFIVFFENSIRFTTSINSPSKIFNKRIFKDNEISLKSEELEIINKNKEENENKDSFKSFLNETIKSANKCLIYSSLSNFEFHSKEKKETIKKVIISGKGVELKGLDEFLLKKLKTGTKIGYPLINSSKNFKKISKNIFLGYEVAIGLALRNFESEN